MCYGRRIALSRCLGPRLKPRLQRFLVPDLARLHHSRTAAACVNFAAGGSSAQGAPHIEKEMPQPQLEVAFGFTTTNLAPISSSVKSIVAFSRNGRLTWSISTR